MSRLPSREIFSDAARHFLTAKSTSKKMTTAEEIVIKVNNGKRKVPTLKVGDRYFACSPFNAEQLANELDVPLNP